MKNHEMSKISVLALGARPTHIGCDFKKNTTLSCFNSIRKKMWLRKEIFDCKLMLALIGISYTLQYPHAWSLGSSMTTCILSHLLAKLEVQDSFSVITQISDSPKRTRGSWCSESLTTRFRRQNLEAQLSEDVLWLYEFCTCNYLCL